MDTIKVIESQQSFAKSVYLDFMSKRFGITQTSITDLQSSISQKYLCDWQNAKKDVPEILEVTYDTFTPTDTSDPCGDVNAPTWCILCADGSCSDQECLIVNVVDSLGNPIKDFEIYIDGTNSGFTNEDGEFLYTFENASVDTKHTIQVCYCFETVGGCRQQKITIIVEADESAEECKVLTPCIDIKKKIIDELLTQVQVFFNDVLKYTQQCSIDLKFTLKNQDGDLIDATFNGYDIVVNQPVAADARVSNSDDTYDVNVASGGDLELPDIRISNSDNSYLVTSLSVKNVDLPNITLSNSDGSRTQSLPSVQDIIVPDVNVRNSDNSYSVTSPNNSTISVPDITISNSDDSYSVSSPSVIDVDIPDEAITVNSAAFITKPSKKDQDILLRDVSGTAITPVSLAGNTITILDAVTIKGLMPTQTGQTTSYATNDDGDLQRGRLTDFDTIPYNNPFGATDRFTDSVGTQVYADGVVVDWSTWDGGSSVLGYATSNNSSTSSTQNWDNWMTNSPYTVGAFSNFYVANSNELLRMMKTGTTFLNYTPFSANNPAGFWIAFSSTTTEVSSTARAISGQSNIDYPQRSTKTTNGYALLVRDFTITGTTLS